MSDNTLFDDPVSPVRRAWQTPQHVLDGERLRDEGLRVVAEHEDANGDWNARALEWILSLAPGMRFTSEDLRLACGNPTRPNAPGAVVRTAAGRSLIVRTGTLVAATRPVAHGTDLPEWIRL